MSKTHPVYVGSYRPESNSYKVEPLASTCDSNARLYMAGFAGYVPISVSASEDEVRKELESFKAERCKMFAEFESAIVDCITEIMGNRYEVRIEASGDTSVEESYLNDEITIIPEYMKECCFFPVVPLKRYYNMLHTDPVNAASEQEAIEHVAHEVIKDLMDMWGRPEAVPGSRIDPEETAKNGEISYSDLYLYLLEKKVHLNIHHAIPAGFVITKNGCCEGKPVIVYVNKCEVSKERPEGLNYSCECSCGGWNTDGHATIHEALENWAAITNLKREG